MSAAVWDMRDADPDGTQVYYAHKGDCHKAIEQKIEEAGGGPGWDELDTHLVFVLDNLGLVGERMKRARERAESSEGTAP